MSLPPIEVSMELTNRKVKFTGLSKSNPEAPITVDYLQPIGDGEGFLGLELLVMSFAGCVSTAIVALLRRSGKGISVYKMNTTGIKREKPLSLEKICFEVLLESGDTSEEELEKILLMVEDISPVWIAIKNNVEVSWQYKIVKPV